MTVSITRLRVRSRRFLVPFIIQALRAARQARKAEGCLSVTLLRDRRNTFWTRTVWTSEAAVHAYMLSGVHRQVMRKLLEWCDEAAVVRWTQDSSDAPSWPEAHGRLQEQGRASKVNHPSEDQTAYRIPPIGVFRD